MNDKVWNIMKKKEFQVFFLFWRFHFSSSLQLHRRLDTWNKNFLWKTKKFWLKESVIRRVVILVGVSCRMHLSIWLKHHGMTFFLLSLALFVCCFAVSSHFIRNPSQFPSPCLCFIITRQLVVTCATSDVHRSDLITIIMIRSHSHYEMRRGSWQNLDLESI